MKFLVSASGSAGMGQAMIGVILSQIDHAQIDEVAGEMINKWGRRRGAVISQWQALQYDWQWMQELENTCTRVA